MFTTRDTTVRPNNRVQRLRSQIFGILPEICIERGYYLTESYQKTESEPAVMRRAKALAHVLAKLSISIEDDE